jgi:hypothetical protein
VSAYRTLRYKFVKTVPEFFFVLIEENIRTHTKPFAEFFFFAECNTRPSGLCDSIKSVPNVPKTLGKDPLHRVFSICQCIRKLS